MVDQNLPPARHELQDVTFPSMLIGFGAVLIALLSSVLVIMLIYPSALVDHRLSGALPSYPKPHLQSDPAADFRHFLEQELGRLNSAGWVDQAHDVAHIPIGEAMRQVARQGIPDWPASSP